MSQERPFRDGFHSLYFKLFAIYFLTFFGIVGGVFFGIRLSTPVSLREQFHHHLDRYAGYLAQDIGAPPDFEKASKIAKDSGLRIWIRGPETQWKSPNQKENASDASSVDRLHLITTQNGPYEFQFTPLTWKDREHNPLGFAAGILISLLVLVFSFGAIRVVFLPIRQMERASRALGNGDWKVRVPVCGSGELQTLAGTLNTMAEKIERQLGAMRDLLLTMSHELRSPLTRMRVALEFVADEKLRKSLIEEIQSLDRLTGMILERERVVQRPDSLVLEKVNLGMWIEELLAPFKERLPGLNYQGPVAPIQQEVDAGLLTLALRNLLENAFKFSQDSAQSVEVLLENRGTGFALQIKDHGAGMSEEVLSRLGEPFMKADRARGTQRAVGGYGLGLSLAFAILRAHGFEIQVQSTLGQGTCIRIFYPHRMDDAQVRIKTPY